MAKYASLVIEEETGRVLHERHADVRRHPASLTKIMTLYMVFNALQRGEITMDTPMKVSRRAEGMAPSKLGLNRGTKITVRDAILALVTKSANDAAVVVAEHLGGTEIDFARMMTETAKQIGMKNTTFRNASGLYNKHQLSTARDMATLARRIHADFPAYFDMFSVQQFTYKGRTYKNHNNLLGRYHGADGIKTGYIGAAGFNLVASVQRDNVRLIGVVFGGRSSKTRDRHMVDLLDKSFQQIAAVAIRAPKKPDPNAVAARNTAPKADVYEGTTQGLANAEPPSQLAALQSLSEDRAANPKAPSAALIQDVNEALNRAPAAGSRVGQDVAWSIQVGAFRSQQRARMAAHQARMRLGAPANEAVLMIHPTQESARPLYRARLAGFSQAAAKAACLSLKKQNLDCVAFPPDENAQMADRRQ